MAISQQWLLFLSVGLLGGSSADRLFYESSGMKAAAASLPTAVRCPDRCRVWQTNTATCTCDLGGEVLACFPRWLASSDYHSQCKVYFLADRYKGILQSTFPYFTASSFSTPLPKPAIPTPLPLSPTRERNPFGSSPPVDLHGAQNFLARYCPVGCRQWSDGCNICTCSAEGQIRACTRKFCANPGRAHCVDVSGPIVNPKPSTSTTTRAIFTKPNNSKPRTPECPVNCRVFAPDSCNECLCDKNGHTMWCSRMSCPDKVSFKKPVCREPIGGDRNPVDDGNDEDDVTCPDEKGRLPSLPNREMGCYLHLKCSGWRSSDNTQEREVEARQQSESPVEGQISVKSPENDSFRVKDKVGEDLFHWSENLKITVINSTKSTLEKFRSDLASDLLNMNGVQQQSNGCHSSARSQLTLSED